MALPCARAWARRRRALAAALALALAATLSGCQSNPEPPPLERAATSPSPAPSPTLAALTLPPEARGTSKAAAKAFVRHWVDVLNYAGPSGDTQALRELSYEDCAACSAIADFIDEVHEAGGEISGEGWEVQTAQVVSGERGRDVVVDAQVRVHPQQVRIARHGRTKSFDGGNRLKTFWLSAKAGSWAVARLDQPR